jgi:Domain of unknown function (DUF4126)
MNAVEILGIASGLSLLAGWRLYATVFITGIVQLFGLWEMPAQLASLHILTNPWILAVSGIGFAAEFFADKIAWLDSIWDSVHTFIRPVGGALIALAVVQEQAPEWQVLAFLLGGGAALLSHGAKAGTRAVVNTSPEPFSNVGVSLVEDGLSASGLWLTLAHPAIAFFVALGLSLLFAVIIWKLYRFVKKRLKRAS